MYLGQLSFKEAKEKIQNKEAKDSNFFYDWFCDDSALQRKAAQLLKKVQYIVDTYKLDESKIRITMKNNCPCQGILYDSFWITNMATNDYLYVAPRLGHWADELYEKCDLVISKDRKHEELLFNNYREFKKELKNLTTKVQEIF